MELSEQRLSYKISEAATALGVSPASIRRLIARGIIKPVRILRHVLVPASELRKIVKP